MNRAVNRADPQTEFVSNRLRIRTPAKDAGVSQINAKGGTNETIEKMYDKTKNPKTNSLKNAIAIKNQLNIGEDFPHAFVVSVTGSRRTGKTTIVESIINEMQAGKPRFNYVFLFSPTLAGFEAIPNSYKYQNLDVLPSIIQAQQDLTTWNKKALKKDRKKCSICLVLDDMVSSNELKNKLLLKLALNGRHVNSKDPEKNELCTFILSQSITGVPKKIRQNVDLTLASRLTSKNDRKLMVEESMILDSSRGGINDAYLLYDNTTLERDFAFIAILNHISNKSTYEKYVRSYVATIPDGKAKIRWFGKEGDADWMTKDKLFNFID